MIIIISKLKHLIMNSILLIIPIKMKVAPEKIFETEPIVLETQEKIYKNTYNDNIEDLKINKMKKWTKQKLFIFILIWTMIIGLVFFVLFILQTFVINANSNNNSDAQEIWNDVYK